MRWYTWKFWIFAKGCDHGADAVIDGDGTWKPFLVKFIKNIYWRKL